MTTIRAAVSDVAFNIRTFARELAIASLVLGIGLLAPLEWTMGVETADALHRAATSRGSASTAPAAAPSLPTTGVAYLTEHVGVPLTVACGRPVIIRYDADGAPYDAEPLIRLAATTLARSAGVRVAVEDGAVDWNAPSPRDTDRVTVSWTGSLPSQRHGVETLGEGEPLDDGHHLIGGRVALAADTAWPSAGTDPGSQLGVVLHELGHAAGGLDHDATGQMQAVASHARPPGYSVAESAALRWIFTSDCFNKLTTTS